MSRTTPLLYIFCAALFLTPSYAHAQDFEISFEPTFQAAHAGFFLYDGNPVDPFSPPDEPTIRSSEVTSVDGEWAVTGLMLWPHDVPQSRGVYVLARIDPDTFGLEGGVPVRGGNYDLAHAAFSASATSTHTLTFSMPFLGDTATPSGTYRLFAAELPETKSVYDEATGIETTSPYTDDDLAAWLAYHSSPNIFGPTRMTSDATFKYVNNGPPPCTEDCFSNVLFLPGVKTSRLYRPQVIGAEENRLWEPDGNRDIEDLFMNPDGTSVRDDIYARDILDAHFAIPVFGNGDVYKTFMKFMNDEVKAGVINEWNDIPYDWRLSLDDILESGAQTGDNISYLTATDTPYIIQKLKRLAGTSKSGKVTIIGHSNGGLLAKALVNKLAETGEESLVDKIIFVGVPQTGTPKAIAVLLHGYDESLGFGLVTKTSTARTLAENLPAAYNLLPSQQYFADVATPPVEFSEDAMSAAFRSAYGDAVDSYAELRSFLLGVDGHAKPDADDTDAPNVLNESLLTDAEALHTALDSWEPPDGVELYEVAGTGLPTPVSIIYLDSCRFCLLTDPHVSYEPEMVVEGDGTVIEASAHAGTGQKYYFNILQFKINTRTGISHASIMRASDVTSLIDQIIKEDTASALPSTITTTAPSFAGEKHLIYRVHSPVSLDIYDADGNHTGIATTTLSDGTVVSFVENNVAGTYYDQFGEVQYVFSDGSTPVDIILDGQGSGVATFDVEELTGNTSVASTTFVNIPVRPQTIISMSMSAGGSISGASALAIDEDGDGETDVELPTGGIVMYEDFVAVEEEVPETPAPQTQSGGGGGGGGNGPIVAFTAIATSTSTSTPKAIQTMTATSSLGIAATTSFQVNQLRPTVKAITVTAATSQKQPVMAKQQNTSANNVKLVAGAAASIPTTSSPTAQKWWTRIYQAFRNVVRSVLGL